MTAFLKLFPYSTERLTECGMMAGRALEGDFLTHAGQVIVP
jgi:hypothetical protein